jgi:DNA-binding NarL/FixJ family response regulator
VTTHRVQCHAYIVYHNGLFAEGMRSILEEARNSVEVIGMESDIGRALNAIASLKPEVVIVEEPTSGEKTTGCLEALLERAAASKVVLLSLAHNRATVYQRQQVATFGPADLVKAIRGGSRKEAWRPEPHMLQTTAASGMQPASGRNGGGDRSGRRSRVRRTRRQGKTKR